MAKKSKNKEEKLLEKGIMQIFHYYQQPFNYKQMASKLEIRDAYYREKVKKVLTSLAERNKIKEVEPGKYKMAPAANLVEGTIEIIKSGAGYFLTKEGAKDFYVAPSNTGNALNKDVVRVQVLPKRRGRTEAIVKEIAERFKTHFSGVVEIKKDFAFFMCDDRKVHVDFFIPLDKLNGAKDGQKVIAEITSWDKKQKNPVAEITKVLGYPGENEAEIHAILAEFSLPYDFPEEVNDAAGKIPVAIPKEEILRRRDFREVTTFTIDPDDAKDFDDALSVKFLENDQVEVGIHIADVSHYIQEGDVIDEEAVKRATSVYLVDRVVPMLPEVLSNGLCSLRPNEEKLCFSAVFVMDFNGKVKSEWFGRTVIESDRRFTYEEAQAIIEGEKGDYDKEILLLNDMAKKMRKKRVESGAIEFGGHEVKFRLDEEGQPQEAFLKITKESNKLIEEFMLLANRKVATYVGKDLKKTFVYRIHDEPDPEKLRAFKDFIKQFGLKLNYESGEAAAKAMNKVLKEMEGHASEKMVRELAVRSMSKAEYSTENVGHYGLAFDYYSHFTSPIRRYPDVMVHRLLQFYLDKNKSAAKEPIEELCKHASSKERQATEAERASIKYMQVKFMTNKVGDTFMGRITGATTWGIYVELNELYCEGMVSLRDITDDHYIYDESQYMVIGKRYGETFKLGDVVQVRVKSANLVAKQLDFDQLEKISF